jgi:TolA-binding protein
LIFVVYSPQIDSQQAMIVKQDQQITHLNQTIVDLNEQVEDLQGQLQTLRERYTANIITALGVKDMASDDSSLRHLFIQGTVSNTGVVAAINAGLQIKGYGSNHEVLIDLTTSFDSYATYQDGFTSTKSLATLAPTQSQSINIAIYHQGTVVDWTITPVYNDAA